MSRSKSISPFFVEKGLCVHISSENGVPYDPDSDVTIRVVSPSVVARDIDA